MDPKYDYTLPPQQDQGFAQPQFIVQQMPYYQQQQQPPIIIVQQPPVPEIVVVNQPVNQTDQSSPRQFPHDNIPTTYIVPDSNTANQASPTVRETTNTTGFHRQYTYERTYSAIDCTMGRWLMWDAIVSSFYMCMPSKLPPEGICATLSQCFGWIGYVIFFPFTLILMIIFAFVGLLADSLSFFTWFLTFGYCCKRCKPHCDVVEANPHHWLQNIVAGFCCTC